MTPQEMLMQQQGFRQRSNLRVGLILATVALAVFFGFILYFWLLGR